ncbi:MAG: rod shape-determining protein MreC [Eubacteriales bacterium]|nr:rod shape-determining protein MreC [Eubacteriales bacterium]
MKKVLKRVNFRFILKSKHLLAIMTLFCICCIIATFASGLTTAPFQDATAVVIVPFEKSINRIGKVFNDINNSFKEKDDLIAENEQLKQQLDTLTTENGKLISSQSELLRLQQLYELDQEYSDFPKIAAKIISKDPSNWYSTFMINKGTNDGIRVNNNVIAGKGLVGIVTDVGTNWATVRSIIDDSSNVSASAVSTGDNCIIQGDLELIEEGKLRITQLYDLDDKVTIGERIVTSNISEKYVEGLFIGYVSEVKQDTNNLTKTGTVVTPVDFSHLKEVFVITVNKSDMIDEQAEVTSVEE